MTELQDLFKSDDSMLVPGALRGYRRWLGVAGRGLRSTSVDCVWSPYGVEFASCRSVGGWTYSNGSYIRGEAHEAPHAGCGCGIYGWYRPDDARIPLAGAMGSVFGVIEVTGRTIMGSHGFRASAARVLGVTSDDPKTFDKLGDLDCIYPVFDTEQELLEAFPPQDVSSLIDHECDGKCLSSIDSPLVVAGNGTFATLTYCTCPLCTGSSQQFSGSFNNLAQQTANLATVSRKAAEAMKNLGISWDPAPRLDPPDPKQAALESRRNRNTGPSQERKRLRDVLKRR